MNPDNLIAQVIYRENSKLYSGVLHQLLGFSPEFGIAVNTVNRYPRSPVSYVFNSQGDHLNRATIEKTISKLSQDVDHDISQVKDATLDYFGNLYDFTGEQISKSKYKIMLPCSLDYNTFVESSILKFNAVYTDVEYIGLLEYVLYQPFLRFDYQITPDIIDRQINSRLNNSFVNLNNSVDFCRDTIQHIADVHQEKIDIEAALEYFMNKSLALVILAIDQGINHIIENGYAEYKQHVLKRYHNAISHKGDVVSWKMRTLLNANIGMSYAMYGKLVDNLGVSRNKNQFIAWHQGIYETSEDKKNSLPALLNTISKLMFGKRFDPKTWTMESQIVFDCAAEEKLGISNGVEAFKEYVNKHY